MEIVDPGNELPPLTEIYAVVSRDEQDREAVCGMMSRCPECGMPSGGMPMVTANPRILEKMKILATELAQAGTGKRIKIVRFSHREDLEEMK